MIVMLYFTRISILCSREYQSLFLIRTQTNYMVLIARVVLNKPSVTFKYIRRITQIELVVLHILQSSITIRSRVYGYRINLVSVTVV